MEKKEIYEKLNKNVQEMSIVENEISKMQLAIYQKNIDKIKQDKIDELNKFFEQQAMVYNQKNEKFKELIEKNIAKYEKQIDKLVSAYDNFYINVFRILQGAMNNQKISIANIVTLTEKLRNKDNSEEENKEITRTILACAQKKLNYSTIIDECKARIEWCTQNIQKDMNEIFVNNVNQFQLTKENIFNKIKRIIYNKFTGKNKYKMFLKNYESEYIKVIKNKNSEKIFEILYVLRGVIKQMKIVKKQINEKYDEMICG